MLAAIVVLLAVYLLAGCSTQPPAGIQSVQGFDIQRYQGQWYEIARLDHGFEHGLIDVTATYTPRSDGGINVVNCGYDLSSSSWKEAHGRAYFNGAADIGSLKVSFFWPFFGGYHVVALDSDYRWAMVIGNDRSYLWILSRTAQLPDPIKARLVVLATGLGFDTSKLIWVQHRNRPVESSECDLKHQCQGNACH